MEITYDEETDGVVFRLDDGRTVGFSMRAIASWSQLLGYTDVVDTVDAILNADHQSNDEDGHWFDAYVTLSDVEVARQLEEEKAVQEGRGDDPRSPALRGVMAARQAMNAPTGCTKADDSALSMARRQRRDSLRLPDPKASTSLQRAPKMTCKESPQFVDNTDGAKMRFSRVGRRMIAETLQPRLDLINKNRERFAHGITQSIEDPWEEPRRKPEDVLNAYSQAAGVQPSPR